MDIAAASLPPDRLYKLLTSTVMPRPIALVSTLDSEGRTNAAPFSFFNVFSNAPPLLILGIEGNGRGGDRPYKDSAQNIIDRGEFVVNLVSRAIAEQMVWCSIDFPEGMSEFDEVGFTQRPSKQIGVPGIAQSPASLECRVAQIQHLPYNRTLITGEILHFHFADGVIDDNLHVDADRLDLVARMHGAGWYSTTRDRFELLRMTVAQWEERKALASS